MSEEVGIFINECKVFKRYSRQDFITLSEEAQEEILARKDKSYYGKLRERKTHLKTIRRRTLNNE